MARKIELIQNLLPWWTANGWNPQSLKDMSYRQLWAISYKAAASNWAIKPVEEHGAPKQLTLF